MLITVLKVAGVYVLLSLVCGTVLLLLGGWWWHPTSMGGWIAFFASVMPIQLAGEWLRSVILENRFASSLGKTTPPGSISWSRIAYAVAAYLVVFAVVGAAYLGLARLFEWP